MNNLFQIRYLLMLLPMTFPCSNTIAQTKNELSEEERKTVITGLEKVLAVTDDYVIPDLSNDLFLSIGLGGKKKEIEKLLDSLGYTGIPEKYTNSILYDEVIFLGINGKFKLSFDKEDNLSDKTFSFEWSDAKTDNVSSNKPNKKKDGDEKDTPKKISLETYKKYALRIIRYTDNKSSAMIKALGWNPDDVNSNTTKVNAIYLFWQGVNYKYSVILSNFSFFGINSKNCSLTIVQYKENK